MSPHWKQVRFSEVADIASGLIDPRKEPHLHSLHIGPENIESETGNISDLKTAAELNLISGKFSFGADAIVYSKIRPNLNKVCFPGFAGVCSADAYVITPRDGVIDRNYLLQVMRSKPFVEQAVAVSMRTGMPKINQSDLNGLFVPLPPIHIQKHISAIVSAWDRSIRHLTDLIAAKLRFKQGLMQQLLTGKRRLPEFTTSSFVEFHIGDVLKETFRPVTWDDEELYRLASIRRHSGGLFWREALLGRQIKVKKLHSLCEDDFLISHIQAAYGAMGLVPVEFAGGKVSDMYTILTPRVAGTIDMRYIDYLSQMKRMRHQAYLACNGFFAERLRLNFDPAEFMKQKILLPESEKEQRKISDLLDTLVGQIRTLDRELDALKSQKKGLMQKLLTGQVRVKL